MGGSGAKTSGEDATSDMSQKAFDSGYPAFDAAMQMFTETINTGGVQSRQPIYAQAAEKSLQAGNQAKIAMAEDNARTGLAGTPFAEAEEKQLDLTSRQNAAMVPMQMENADYWNVLTNFFPGAGGAMGQGIQGNTALAQGEAVKFGAMADLIASMFGTGMGGVQGLAKG